jgi:hypothetical protein
VSDEDAVSAAIDKLADTIEEDVEETATNLGLSVAEVSDRLATEVKARFPDQ